MQRSVKLRARGGEQLDRLEQVVRHHRHHDVQLEVARARSTR